MKNKHPRLAFLLTGFAVALLSACGGSDDDGGGRGQMKLSVTDAPVDGAQAVVVKFTGVELTRDGSDPVNITLASPKSIDLLNQGGTASAVLFDQPINAGNYQQLRLVVVADGDPANSYITMSDGAVRGLNIPSGSQTGLKLVSGFSVPDSGVVAYTVDFDLRKSITCPPGLGGTCQLKPALRLVADNSVGAIQGTVAPARVPAGCSPGVYLYSGTVTAPEDINTAATVAATQPIASKVPVVTTNSGGGYYYQFTFLPPGSYTVALTCQAPLDNADLDDPTVLFSPVTGGVTVTATQTTTVDFP